MDISPIFLIIVLIVSVIIHEVSHGYMALVLGDTTAKYAGRLTLNPISHIDPIGSILVPIITSIAGFTFGWAKPVPYNPYNLRNQRWGEAMVAAAGPLSNIAIAIIFAVIVRYSIAGGGELTTFASLSMAVVLINIVLAVFNLMPIPPLDGSKILFSLMPSEFGLSVRRVFEQYGFFVLIFFVFFIWQFMQPVIYGIFGLLVGL